MFQDKQLCDEAMAEMMELDADDRASLDAWFDGWLAEAAAVVSGPWVEEFRPRLRSLVNGLSFAATLDGSLKVDCKPIDKPTLTLLLRGSRRFDAVDQLALKLCAVIMARTHEPRTHDRRDRLAAVPR